MAPSLGESIKAFWHTMTSNDRHANYDSPYRSFSNSNTPTSSRNPALDSVTTPTLGDSRQGLNSPYINDDPARSNTALAGAPGRELYSPRSPSVSSLRSPTMPYSPGARSSSMADVSTGIQLQDFSEDGQPPPQPIVQSWNLIDNWLEENYPELFDQLSYPATVNDINELEHHLDCSLPMEVRESLQIHDGQERGGNPSGVVFGAMLLDCEEILDEWKTWKQVAHELAPYRPSKNFAGPSSSRQNSRQDNIQTNQDSQPDGAVQKVYAHPGWIPMARDWGGNLIAIDLAPGPKGRWGQVIIFGRDYDCKYVVARSWGAFLARMADDLCGPASYIDEETKELKLKPDLKSRFEPGYLDILRVRADRIYGRKPPRKRPTPRLTTNGIAVIQNPLSPLSMTSSPATYLGASSPINGDRGRGIIHAPVPRRPSASQSPHASNTPTRLRALSKVNEEQVSLPKPAILSERRDSASIGDLENINLNSSNKRHSVSSINGAMTPPLRHSIEKTYSATTSNFANDGMEDVSLDDKTPTPATTTIASMLADVTPATANTTTAASPQSSRSSNPDSKRDSGQSAKSLKRNSVASIKSAKSTKPSVTKPATMTDDRPSMEV